MRINNLLAVSTFAMFFGSETVIGSEFDKGISAYKSGGSEEALAQLKYVAESGNVDAQFYLGHMYNEGDVVLKDDNKAVKWFSLAAKQGNAFAQARLAPLFGRGVNVPKDPLRMYMWCSLAAYNGDSASIYKKAQLIERMASGQVALGDKMATRCLDSGYTDC